MTPPRPVDAPLLRVRAGDVTLAYRAWGRGPPLVLVHGGPGGSGSYWLSGAGRLAEARTLYAVDLRGHGESERRGPYTMRRLGEDIARFREALGLGRAALLGHSFGAPVAIEAALADPSFDRLVLVGGFADTKRMLVAPDGLLTKLALGARLAGWNALHAVRRAPPHLPFLRDLLRRAEPMWEGRATPPWLDDVLFASVVEPLDAVVPLQWSLAAWSAWSRLGRLPPTLVVVGSADRVGRPQAGAIAAGVPGGRLAFLEGAGHSPFFERPEAFAEAVLPFLSGEPV